MSGLSSFVKTFLIPLLVAVLLYLFVSFVLLPLHRRYVRKYQHYLPLHGAATDAALHSLSTHTSPSWIRARFSGLWSSLSARLPFALPFAATPRTASATGMGAYDDDDDDDFDIEDGEGEGMVGFEPMDRERRREALERQRGADGASERRLSRELEEGFRDSSSDSEDDGVAAGRRLGAMIHR
ncbi:hypothetical protein BFW01_g10870 [Lasiodiplodia theobromae]|uniref:Uncharacterized protein n=1 Tax=Lasiodiplodia theobromae TaxID=45133 RepID=A0A5N5DUI4_9PEZI|nr:uncharacterized protein LTHEOB_8235 [Lasiodiplodia theobromae]KAB2581417.1 hypothetical protein DBV05_g67 [Lasiodiplodia theobromae]KAF4541654.1 hypothetical protein LTHEOB_8235 [Lasiodiplodia theobromae]KAF9629667.1 hypothetical protein BFW01_g10870 [Lasiodiplodia theobromae]